MVPRPRRPANRGVPDGRRGRHVQASRRTPPRTRARRGAGLKVVALVLAAAALAAGGVAGGYALGSRGGDTEAVATTKSRPWKSCSNAAFGFTIRYPADWFAAAPRTGAECLYFEPEPFEVPRDSDFTGTALEVQVPQQSFDDLVRGLADERFARVIARAETTVAGRRAVRIETEATGEGLLDRGTRQYAYVVDREGPPLVVQTTSRPGRDFAALKRVVDSAVGAIRLTAPREAVAGGLPPPVAEKHAAVLAAAEARDWDALATLVDPRGFTYTYGGPVEGGAVAHWKSLETTTDERPLETLAAILRMPYTLHRGIYVWPFAFDTPPEDLTEYERELLAPIADAETIRGWREFGGYLGWRAGIEPDGDWVFFVAGD